MMFETLENRRLLSTTLSSALGGIWTDPILSADRTALAAATKTLLSDARSGRSTIREDQKAVRTEYQKLIDDKGEDAVNLAIQPLKDKLRADEKAKNKDLRSAAADLRTLKRTWAKTVLADLKVWREARRSGDQKAIDDADAKLVADKDEAQKALKPIRDKILAVKDKWRPIITADHDAIESKLASLDPALKPLYDKLAADSKSLNDKLAKDADAVKTATDKLAADFDAYKKAHSDIA